MNTSRPLTSSVPGEHASSGAPTPAGVKGLQVGQHLLAAVLTGAGVMRAITEGTGVTAAVVAGLAVGVCYTAGVIVAAHHRPWWPARWWLFALTAVWVAAVAVSPEFVWLAFLLWLLAGHLLPGWWAIGYAVLVYAVAIAAPVVHHGSTGWANIFGPLIGGVFALGISRGYLFLLREAAERERLLASLAQAQRESADLQDELVLTQRHAGQVAERTRLARDIHDTVAQSLSSIRLLAHAATGGSSPPDAARTLNQVENLAGEGLVDVRRIVTALAPSELEDGALAAALSRMLDRLRDQSGIATDLHVDATLPALPAAVEVALMRTAQSALANVRLHAAAGRVVVSLIDDQETVRLDIIDDGQGFDVRTWEQAAPHGPESGYGLRFMRSRLRELGGGLDIESVPGDGAALSAHLPLHVPGKEN